mmetsp:Transcript_4438/g.10863  ORF Transcript_4438/g.10863 Transcript_4438/m.10863 type:complete len:100 (+) Transcript_4438:922-1221(+)
MAPSRTESKIPEACALTAQPRLSVGHLLHAAATNAHTVLGVESDDEIRSSCWPGAEKFDADKPEAAAVSALNCKAVFNSRVAELAQVSISSVMVDRAHS